MTKCRVRIHTRCKAEKVIRRCIRTAVKNEKLPNPCMIDVFIVGDETIKTVNRVLRRENKVTDVLSFPAWGGEETPVPDMDTGRVFLGDIIISYSRAIAQARCYKHSKEREFGYLAVHGALHLLGYDHETEWDNAVMRSKEEAVMSRMGLTR